VDQLSAPHGLAFDPEGEMLYVADTGNRRVVAYGIEDGELVSPQVLPLEDVEEAVDVAVTPQGIVFVLDTVAPRLLRYDPVAEASSMVVLGAGFYRPRGLATDTFGLLYVADTGGGRVAIVAEDGAVAAEFGGRETPLGRGQPVDVTATGRSIWAIAAEEGRLWRLDTLGSLTAVQPTNTIDGPQLASMADGSLYLSDPARHQVLYLSAEGQPLGALADAGAFELPTGVAAFRSGDSILLAVSDTATCTVTLWQARAELLPGPQSQQGPG
jgi:sugar lactone lactonase YvrE